MLQCPADTSPATHRPLAAVPREEEECKRFSHSAAYAVDVPYGTLGLLLMEDPMDVSSFVSKLGRKGTLLREYPAQRLPGIAILKGHRFDSVPCCA